MRSALSLSLLILLSACMGGTEEPPQIQTSAIEEAEPTIVQPEPEIILPDAQILQGHTPKDIQTALGEPTLVRRDGNVQVMLFERTACVLEVIFYEKSADDYFRATDINARSVRGETFEADNCLAIILGSGVSLDLPSL